MKTNDQRKIKKKKRKVRRRKKKKTKPMENPPIPQPIEEQGLTNKISSKEIPQLKTFHMFEPWIKRDEFDVRIFVSIRLTIIDHPSERFVK